MEIDTGLGISSDRMISYRYNPVCYHSFFKDHCCLKAGRTGNVFVRSADTSCRLVELRAMSA